MQFIPSKIVFHVQDKSIPLRLTFSSLKATLVDARGRSYILSWPEVKHIIYAYRYIIQRKFNLKLFTLSMMSVAHVECLLNQLFKTHPRLIAINQIRERKVEEKKVAEKEGVVFYVRVTYRLKTSITCFAKYNSLEIPLYGLSIITSSSEKLAKIKSEVQKIAEKFSMDKRVNLSIVERYVHKFYVPKAAARDFLTLIYNSPTIRGLLEALKEIKHTYSQSTLNSLCKVVGAVITSYFS